MHKSNWNMIKNPTLLLLWAWWQCFLWLRAKEDTSCKRTGHLKVMEHLISFHPVLRCLLTLWRAPLPGFLTNSLFSQLAYSIKHHLWLESSNARLSLEWWLSIVCPMNLEATSRTWGEDKGQVQGHAKHSTAPLHLLHNWKRSKQYFPLCGYTERGGGKSGYYCIELSQKHSIY